MRPAVSGSAAVSAVASAAASSSRQRILTAARTSSQAACCATSSSQASTSSASAYSTAYGLQKDTHLSSQKRPRSRGPRASSIECSFAHQLHTSSATQKPKGKESSDISAVPRLSERAITPQASLSELQAELSENILPGFPLPDQVALQVVTHESWDYGKGLAGHNRRLSFLGRRALKAFFILFFDQLLAKSTSSSSSASAEQARKARNSLFASSSSLIEDLLHTSALGKRAGSNLRLERVMRWTPAVIPSSFGGQGGANAAAAQETGRETGLFKIRGVCVEAVVGAIYHQYGGHMAQLFFQSQILPTLDVSGQVGRWPSPDVAEWLNGEIQKCAEESTVTLNRHIQARATAAAAPSISSTPGKAASASSAGQALDQGKPRVLPNDPAHYESIDTPRAAAVA